MPYILQLLIRCIWVLAGGAQIEDDLDHWQKSAGLHLQETLKVCCHLLLCVRPDESVHDHDLNMMMVNW